MDLSQLRSLVLWKDEDLCFHFAEEEERNWVEFLTGIKNVDLGIV